MCMIASTQAPTPCGSCHRARAISADVNEPCAQRRTNILRKTEGATRGNEGDETHGAKTLLLWAQAIYIPFSSLILSGQRLRGLHYREAPGPPMTGVRPMILPSHLGRFSQTTPLGEGDQPPRRRSIRTRNLSTSPLTKRL